MYMPRKWVKGAPRKDLWPEFAKDAVASFGLFFFFKTITNRERKQNKQKFGKYNKVGLPEDAWVAWEKVGKSP